MEAAGSALLPVAPDSCRRAEVGAAPQAALPCTSALPEQATEYW